MKIAVLGTGMVGQALAGRLPELGHAVIVGTRDPQATLARTEPDGMGNPPFSAWHDGPPERRARHLRRRGGRRRAGRQRDVRRRAPCDVLGLAGADNLAGKVLLDISNPLDFSQGFPPTLFVKDTDSLGEQVQRAFPRGPGGQDPQHSDRHLMVDPEVARRESSTSSSPATTRPGEGDGDRAAGELRPRPTSSTSATSRPPAAPRCCCRCGCG